MKIAVINEVSARDKNQFILDALKKCNVDVINVGMEKGEYKTELTYIHTGFMAAVILNLGIADTVVGGCGTGQGFLNSAMQYPNVFCGLISDPLDSWLFSRINNGNCVSLALNKGFGWAGNVNLEFIFNNLFSKESGSGYPTERAESQGMSRKMLKSITLNTHKPFNEIMRIMDKDIIKTCFSHKPFIDALRFEAKDKELQSYIIKNYLEVL